MARRFAKVSEEEIEEAFFYPSDLVNTKTTIPLRVGEERWIYSYFNLRCRIKASSVRDKTERRYGLIRINFRLLWLSARDGQGSIVNC